MIICLFYYHKSFDYEGNLVGNTVLVINPELPRSLNTGKSSVSDAFDSLNRKKAHIRGRNLMPYATSLAIRLEGPYLQSLIATMPM